MTLLAYFWIPDTWAQTVAYDSIGYAGIIAAAWGIRLYRPAHRAPWWLLLAGQGGFVSGDMLAAVLRRGWGLEPFPGWSDYLCLAGYALQAAGLIMIIRRRGGGVAALLESSIVGTAFGLLAWVIFMKPITLETDLPTVAKLISVGYPALDLVLLALVGRLFTGGGSRNPSYWWLISSISLNLAGDYAWAFTDRMHYNGGTFTSHLIDVLYLSSYLGLGVAALHPSMRLITSPTSGTPSAPLGPVRLILLTTATQIAPILLAWQAASHAGLVADAAAIAGGCTSMFLLVVARMALLVRQVQNQSQLLEQQATTLRQLADKDPLTGLPNRRALDSALEAAISDSRRTGEPLVAAILDLDNFKRYNDTFGHPAGDQLLKGAATGWADCIRSGDLLARFGGEEFVVLLPAAGLEDAAKVMSALQSCTPDDQTFSAGLALWNGQETGSTLLQRADQALYAAKANGRNRWEWDPEPTEAPDPEQDSPADRRIQA